MNRPIGKTYDGGEWTVEAEAFQAYARATDDDNPAYFSDDPIAPPMFHVRPMIAQMLKCARDPELEIDMLRLVHGEHRMQFHAPLRPGDVLSIGATLDAVVEKPAGTIFTFGMFLDRAGERVVEGSTAYFIRAKNPPPRDKKKKKAPAEPPPAPSFEISQQVATDQALRYAAASGDDNPIHTDEAVAKKAGLPRCILHGLCTLALAQRDLIQQRGGDPRRLASLGVRFAGMVFPGDALALQGWEDGDTVRFATLGPSGKPVLAGGEASFR